MNILLVYPRFPDTFWSFRHALWFVRRKAVSPPLGLLTVAAMLPPAWDKRLVDVNVRQMTADDLAWADYVFISGMSIQRASAEELIAQAKTAGVPVVAGGPLFTIEPEAFPDVEHFVLNEAELTLPGFLDDLAQGKAQRMYTTADHPDIRQTPIPLWELVDMKDYASMDVQFSRGCPYNCDFCNVTALLGRKPRIKTTAQIIKELDRLYELGWRNHIFFVDDNLIGNKYYFKHDLLPALVTWRVDKPAISFSSELTINVADDQDMLNKMAEAGFSAIFVGIETPDETSLAGCGKKQNLKRNLVEDVKRIQRAGIQVLGGFIVGFDSDTASIFQRQIDFIQESGIVTAMVGLLQAPPGTGLYERLRQEGRLLGASSGDNVDGSMNFVPVMDHDKLREGYRRILEHLYTPQHYYRRVKTFLSEYQPRHTPTNMTADNLRAFFRSMVLLGIRGKERRNYWDLMVWTLFKHPRLLPAAVTLAIYGYHFRLVCEATVRQAG